MFATDYSDSFYVFQSFYRFKVLRKEIISVLNINVLPNTIINSHESSL